MYYAHRTEGSDRSEWQLLTAHLEQVGELSEKFASQFNAAPWGKLAGMLHDAGKFSKEFQKRLEGNPIPVDHATAGAQFIYNAWTKGGKPSSPSRILAYIIAGHHAGLADYGTDAADERKLARRLKKPICSFEENFMNHFPDLKLEPLAIPIKNGFHHGLQFSLFTRMLFSCLVDADSLDTEKYTDLKQHELRGHNVSLSELLERYHLHMNQFLPPARSIDKLRTELLTEVLAQAGGPPGLYSLTLPTGSGKTLLSLGFALEHAAHNPSMRRIVFVIPYTSIIEQNANVYREVLGSDIVLEHHSNVQLDANEDLEKVDESRKVKKKLELAAENWDSPVVVTTNVQFFESLFSNKRSRCRKLHNLANSIIVLDEAQMMNGEFFKPCLHALEELSRNYGVTVVLSTATQPSVHSLFDQTKMNLHIQEIVNDVPRRFEQFRRVRLEMLGKIELVELAGRMSSVNQSLCIVNTRKAARELFEQLQAEEVDHEAIFHLSARMCPKHRLSKLKQIRDRLDNSQRCLLVSTQLIECGVDVDFPVVYRELAGMDSIAQAAGRCNRNGKSPLETTFVFETEQTPKQGWFGITASVSRQILDRFSFDPLSLEAMRAYFDELYAHQTLGRGAAGAVDQTDQYDILGLLQKQFMTLEFPFEEVAQQFELIQTAARPVLIPYDDTAEKAIQSLEYATEIKGIMRKLQPYVVQLYPQEFAAFKKAGELTEVRENIFVLHNPERWYREDIGIRPFEEQYHAAEVYVF
ncbi:CRISPR-associated helicase, Cas3 family [Paenibacillaceae bacterium GAS479]|nr:CRISPR-associated helicase, Cas3 family [Paenibacillaceae bacterium GAS479]